ncbi:hypothetical protein [Streptomyces sp. ISL-100]|uniref:hypothetical protein n=1 Tax=Streptomyces sp. ISL-100 TaxID=2819173 RepID=UPI001BE559B0|nr:hypothetical protein [Streptomyces sp. ISL-100]MBT2399827.1 hypothetical protein [Streptomyces sp. ISL-100]
MAALNSGTHHTHQRLLRHPRATTASTAAARHHCPLEIGWDTERQAVDTELDGIARAGGLGTGG